MRSPVLAALAGCATLTSGCSFVFVDKYREPPPGVVTPDCTSSYKWPLVDAAITAAAAGLVVYAVATADTDDDVPDTGQAALAGVGSLLLVGHGVSAVVGAVRVKTCREEKRRFE